MNPSDLAQGKLYKIDLLATDSNGHQSAFHPNFRNAFDGTICMYLRCEGDVTGDVWGEPLFVFLCGDKVIYFDEYVVQRNFFGAM